MKIRGYTFEEFVGRVRAFHGFEAIGVIIGGFMVDLAARSFPSGAIFDVVCETPKCLPDAVQLLTPCTLGNGWLMVVNVGRFAVTLYDKETGEGTRVFIDPAKLKAWPEIRAWFLKLKTKKEQDLNLLLDEARRAGADICGIQRVKVHNHLREKKRRGKIAFCTKCGEAYPLADGILCLACQQDGIYEAVESGDQAPRSSSS